MLPPFSIETEEGKAMARHCSVGIEPRVSAERLILLDTQVLISYEIYIGVFDWSSKNLVHATEYDQVFPFHCQPVYSPSVLAEMMRPDGSSTIPVLNAESLSAELAHELMGIQVIMNKE